MAAAFSTNGLPGCSQQHRLIRSGTCFRTAHERMKAPRLGRVQRCARVVTKAAARDSGDDASGRNRIGRSMDDNASTDEPWWKVLFGMQKRQLVEADKKPVGNSLNGKYNVPRPKAAGKSGSVNRSAAGKGARGKQASAGPPMRRTAVNPKTYQRQQKHTRGSSRASSAEPAIVDDDSSFWFDNLYTYWWQEDADRPVLRQDGDNRTDDDSSNREGGSWLGGLFEGSSSSGDVAVDVSGTSACHGTSHDTGSSNDSDTGSSYSSSWDSGSHLTHDSSSYDSSSYDTGSYDTGSYDSGGGGDCGGDAGGD